MGSKYVIGMDFGGTNTRIALVSSSAKVIKKLSCASNDVKSPKLFIPWVVDMIRHLIDHERLSRRSIQGIGIGVPGSVNVDRGLVHFLPNLRAWKNVPLRRELERRLRIPVHIDNDANAMAQGEFLFGAAKGSQHAVFVTLGTGVGGGLLINGRLFHGHAFSACEIGHIRYAKSQTRCACGSRGCIETELGNQRLLARARRLLKTTRAPITKRLINQDARRVLRLEHLTQAARQGEAFAIQFWNETGAVLGDFLAGIANLLNPQVIVIGGGVMGAGNLLLTPVKKALKINAFPLAYKNLSVVRAKLGYDSGLIGAASLVWAKK